MSSDEEIKAPLSVLVDSECTYEGSIRHIQKFKHWGWKTLQRCVLDAERTDSLTTLQFDTDAQNEDVVKQFLNENAAGRVFEH